MDIHGYQLKEWQPYGGSAPLSWWDKVRHRWSAMMERMPRGRSGFATQPEGVVATLDSTRYLHELNPHDPAPKCIHAAVNLIDGNPSCFYWIKRHELSILPRYQRFDSASFSPVQVYLFEKSQPYAFMVTLFPEEPGQQRVVSIAGDGMSLNIAIARFQKAETLTGPEPYEGMLRMSLHLNAYLFEREIPD